MHNEEAGHAWAGMAPRAKWTIRVVTPDADPAGPTPALSDLDDGALVRAAVAGGRGAFDQLVERHRRPVYQVCFRFAGNHEDASDLAQEAFVRAWRGLARFKGDAAFATWLYRIAVNTCLSRLSVRKPALEPLDADNLMVSDLDAHGQLRRSERVRAVRRAILDLPRKQRAALILRAYHDLSHQQIADILGSSVGTVKANFFHALANLKRILKQEP